MVQAILTYGLYLLFWSENRRMAVVKVTAHKYVTIIDPFPMEGVGLVTIQQAPATYRAYHMYDHQADRLIADLDRAHAAGMLDYEIEWDTDNAVNMKKYASFTFNDVSPGGSILLGVIPAGIAVSEVAVRIHNAFDGGTTITVGDAGGTARLMTAIQNNPTVEKDYKRDVDYKYPAETSIYVYFPTGIPTTGSAEVFVYLA